MSVQFREHRGSYLDSMNTVRTVYTFAELCKIIGDLYGGRKYGGTVRPEDVSIVQYLSPDTRNGWRTFVVTYQGDVVGFTNGAL